MTLHNHTPAERRKRRRILPPVERPPKPAKPMMPPEAAHAREMGKRMLEEGKKRAALARTKARSFRRRSF